MYGRNSNINFLLIDELLDGLDSLGQSNFVEILEGLAGQNLVISHSEYFNNIFKNKIIVEKENNISRIL